MINEFENEGKTYVDSMILLSEKLKDKQYLAIAHYTKGGLLYRLDRPQEAIDEAIRSYELAALANYHLGIFKSLTLIAALKSQHGEEDEAIYMDIQALNYLKNHKDQIEEYDVHHLLMLDNISRTYVHNKKLDTAAYYTNSGIELASKLEDKHSLHRFKRLQGQINYYNNNLVKARDTLYKYIISAQGISKADSYYYLGMIEGKFGFNDNKRKYFKSIDSILAVEGLPIIDNVKEIYQFLLKDAHHNNDKLEGIYLNRLFHYDSLIESTNKKIKNITLTKFELPLRELENKNNFDKIERKNKALTILYIVVGFILAVLLFFISRYIKVKILLKRLMNEDIEPISEVNNIVDAKNINIDKEVIERTLLKLDDWEDKKGFLDKNIDQSSLAKELDTNSTYLSRIINTYKKQSFSSYIKDLRVTYAINYVKKNPAIVQTKSMIQLAESFGFSSLDVFNRAFKFKVGLTPAVFFKQIKKSNL
ncbi:AraC family transcriptional regulator [uncultured Eudoraea sp.]|uniref:AraC family transcriptional regulator n=1 Tax=uncultured Eudoraea sp. TaxID=1035614 RepID=UPI002619CCC6|nr:AraC family transcriptional regulator [uncultured Eudoraea sp.]